MKQNYNTRVKEHYTTNHITERSEIKTTHRKIIDEKSLLKSTMEHHTFYSKSNFTFEVLLEDKVILNLLMSENGIMKKGCNTPPFKAIIEDINLQTQRIITIRLLGPNEKDIGWFKKFGYKIREIIKGFKDKYGHEIKESFYTYFINFINTFFENIAQTILKKLFG